MQYQVRNEPAVADRGSPSSFNVGDACPGGSLRAALHTGEVAGQCVIVEQRGDDGCIRVMELALQVAQHLVVPCDASFEGRSTDRSARRDDRGPLEQQATCMQVRSEAAVDEPLLGLTFDEHEPTLHAYITADDRRGRS